MTVRKAVIPAAGLGTRFLPATKSIPKEMIPVLDRPGIQWAVEEAVRAGITDIIFITSRGKASLEDHFDRSPELEAQLESRGKTAELDTVRSITELASIHSVRQIEPLGFGHAVLMAREHVGDEPFIVMVPDEVVPPPIGDEQSLLGRMIEAYDEHGASIVAVKEVPKEEVFSYGIVDPEFVSDDIARIKDFVEKPAVEDAPSNLASVGRYVLTPAVFRALEKTGPGVGNEIQLTDGIKAASDEEGAFAYVHPGPIFDVGRKLDHLKAVIALALRDTELSGPLREYLRSLDHG
jgi:UTP--glucose-1-phosphate uridylyltransferase